MGFPDPREAEPDGLIAVGNDLLPNRLANAYLCGIFPWGCDGERYYWYSPDPRMVLFPAEFRLAKSLRRVVKSGRFEVRIDTCFEEVMRQCAQAERIGQDGTWITEGFIEAYTKMHKLGYAHSFETFSNGRLVGGLYGLSFGNVFFGESMFHLETDASKVAFARLVEFCKLHSFELIDAQQETPHLRSLGGRPIPREDYLQRLDAQDFDLSIRGRWPKNSVVLLLGGNQGDRYRLLKSAFEEVYKRIGPVNRMSHLYETEPWGFESDSKFLNCAMVADTDLDPEAVLNEALAIEAELGRVRNEQEGARPNAERTYASRPIDIDLIFFNSQVVNTPRLQIPHPRMHLRRFVLAPLAEVMPHFEHPTLHKTVAELLENCADEGQVTRIE